MTNFREYRFQVQFRWGERMIAEYKAEGIALYADGEWQNRLKKSYPIKSASKEFNYCLDNMGRSCDLRLIDTKSGRVLDSHTAAKRHQLN